jgi:signal transduction histidine kinase
MRADAHYVDQLDARMSSHPVRLIDTQAIESVQHGGDAVSPAFVESIRQHGILQPLIVSVHGRRYRVIAGRRRLAAAMSAGLREVPCLVQHVDAEQAEQMALASNLPATRTRPAPPTAPAPAGTSAATAELSQAISALASCAGLLPGASQLTQTMAVELIRAEAARALDMLTALRVLRDEMPMARVKVAIGPLIDRAVRGTVLERQLNGIDLQMEVDPVAHASAVKGDAQRLADAICALISATASLVESAELTIPPQTEGGPFPRTVITVEVTALSQRVRFLVSQHAVEVPAAWLARPFDIAWPVKGGAATLTRLQVARKIAHAHGGDIEVEGTAGSTSFTLSLPTHVDK